MLVDIAGGRGKGLKGALMRDRSAAGIKQIFGLMQKRA